MSVMLFSARYVTQWHRYHRIEPMLESNLFLDAYDHLPLFEEIGEGVDMDPVFRFVEEHFTTQGPSWIARDDVFNTKRFVDP